MNNVKTIKKIINESTKEERLKFFTSEKGEQLLSDISEEINKKLEKHLNEVKDEAVYTDFDYNKYKDELILEVTSWEFYCNSSDDPINPRYQCTDWYTKDNRWGSNSILNSKQLDIIQDYIMKYLY